MGHLLDDVSHLGHEAFDLGNRLGGKSEELFAQRHDASAQRFFQGDFQAQVADAGDRQILVQDRLTAALPYRLEGLVKRRARSSGASRPGGAPRPCPPSCRA